MEEIGQIRYVSFSLFKDSQRLWGGRLLVRNENNIAVYGKHQSHYFYDVNKEKREIEVFEGLVMDYQLNGDDISILLKLYTIDKGNCEQISYVQKMPIRLAFSIGCNCGSEEPEHIYLSDNYEFVFLTEKMA